jgi:hypothetical protein
VTQSAMSDVARSFKFGTGSADVEVGNANEILM